MWAEGGPERGPKGEEKERISSPLHAEPRAYVVLDLTALSSPPKPESWAGCLNQLRQPGAPDFLPFWPTVEKYFFFFFWRNTFYITVRYTYMHMCACYTCYISETKVSKTAADFHPLLFLCIQGTLIFSVLLCSGLFSSPPLKNKRSWSGHTKLTSWPNNGYNPYWKMLA